MGSPEAVLWQGPIACTRMSVFSSARISEHFPEAPRRGTNVASLAPTQAFGLNCLLWRFGSLTITLFSSTFRSDTIEDAISMYQTRRWASPSKAESVEKRRRIPEIMYRVIYDGGLQSIFLRNSGISPTIRLGHVMWALPKRTSPILTNDQRGVLSLICPGFIWSFFRSFKPRYCMTRLRVNK